MVELLQRNGFLKNLEETTNKYFNFILFEEEIKSIKLRWLSRFVLSSYYSIGKESHRRVHNFSYYTEKLMTLLTRLNLVVVD